MKTLEVRGDHREIVGYRMEIVVNQMEMEIVWRYWELVDGDLVDAGQVSGAGEAHRDECPREHQVVEDKPVDVPLPSDDVRAKAPAGPARVERGGVDVGVGGRAVAQVDRVGGVALRGGEVMAEVVRLGGRSKEG